MENAPVVIVDVAFAIVFGIALGVLIALFI
jgi:hypothetical protein